jgi:hypothetical protein
MNEALIITGSVIIILWGIAHIIPAKNIIKGFGEISADNKKILAMEVIAEGLTLIFLGALPLFIIVYGYSIAVNALIVYRVEAGFLLVMAVLTLLTGARTGPIWYKICPAVKTLAALLFLFGARV